MRNYKRAARRLRPSDSFSLVELLVVMAIIAILAALILSAGTAVINKGLRSRSSAEIQAISTALEGYKTDNGIYPSSDGTLLTNVYANYDGTSSNYQTNGTVLFTALTGQNYFGAPPTAGNKVYLPSLKANQVGPAGSTTYSYIADPWNHSYGYNTTTGTATSPYNGSGFFDLWSTGGISSAQVSSKPALTNTWLSNWTQ